MPTTLVQRSAYLLLGVTALAAVTVMVGWWLRSQLIVQILPFTAPMQFNTALCFLLSASAVAAGCLRRRRTSLALSGVTIAVSVTALTEYALGSNIGIDRLLAEPFTVVRTSHPGRMAPNTAVCFTVLNLASMIRFWAPERSLERAVIAFYLAALTVLVGAAGLLTFAAMPEATAGWANVTRMALHTASLFTLLGIALMMLTPVRRDRLQTTAALAGLVSGLLSLVLWASVAKSEEQRIAQSLQRELDQFVETLRLSHSLRTQALDNAAAILETAHPQAPYGAIVENVRRMLAEHGEPLIARRSVGTTGWTPVAGNAELLRTVVRARSGAISPSDDGALVHWNSHAEEDPQDTQWRTALKIPLRARISERAGTFPPGVAVRITDGDETVYVSPDADQGLFAARATASFEPAPSVRLRLSATAAPGFGAGGAPGLPSMLLIAGLLFSVTLSLSILFLGISRSRMHALEVERSALRTSNRNLNEFAYVASHDLREPLRGIGASVGFLIEDHGQELTEGARRRLDHVASLVRSMSSLIDDLLRYSRLGTRKAVFARTDLEEVLADSLLRLQHLLDEEGVTVERIGAPLPESVCDGGRVREVFTNLITNALRYNRSQPKRLAVGMIDEGRGAPCIVVEDNGIGIEQKHRDKVFDIFTRLHHRDEFPGGTGAGLSIVRRIIEQHEGRVWIEDAAHFPTGTRFCFTLQARASHAAQRPRQALATRPSLNRRAEDETDERPG